MNVYIIGPVTGIEGDNRLAFERAQSVLESAGHIAFIPHNWVRPGTPWEAAMKTSLLRLLTMWDVYRSSFGLALLDGWEHSRGATIEHNLAAALDIPCKPWREWLDAPTAPPESCFSASVTHSAS